MKKPGWKKKAVFYVWIWLTSLAQAADRPNILFIAVDDLKPTLGTYGHPLAQTPAMDTLAESGTTFLNAHCQQAVCGPSRASIMTGKRPDTIQVWDLKTKIRKTNPGIVMMPETFQAAGYETVAFGKIYDPRSVDGRAKHDQKSWTVPYTPSWKLQHNAVTGQPVTHYHSEKIKALKIQAEAEGNGEYNQLSKYLEKHDAWSVVESADVPDDAYSDGAFTLAAISQMQAFANEDKPFFMAVGFKKPHLPFVAPKKYWDLYERDEIELAPYQEHAENSPGFAYHDGNELRSYSGVPAKGALSPDLQRELIHGYLACTSYIDAQVGLLLEELETLGLRENTIIVLWGDHGWHLGDHGLWAKHTNFEQATRTPLLIAAPGMPAGLRTNAPVELLDLYPTLTDLSGVETPEDLEGVSLKPLLNQSEPSVKEFAMSQFPRGDKMGYALRSNRLRYVAWVPHPENMEALETFDPLAEELYDYEKDPLEKANLLDDPAYAELLPRLRAEMENRLVK